MLKIIFSFVVSVLFVSIIAVSLDNASHYRVSNVCVDICGGGLNQKQVSDAMQLQRELMLTGSATKNGFLITLF